MHCKIRLFTNIYTPTLPRRIIYNEIIAKINRASSYIYTTTFTSGVVIYNVTSNGTTMYIDTPALTITTSSVVFNYIISRRAFTTSNTSYVTTTGICVICYGIICNCSSITWRFNTLLIIRYCIAFNSNRCITSNIYTYRSIVIYCAICDFPNIGRTIRIPDDTITRAISYLE